MRHLTSLCKILVLDLGAGMNALNKRIVGECSEVLVAVEPQRVALAMARNLLTELDAAGIGQARIDIVMVSRLRSSLQTSWQAAETILDHSVQNIVTPAPELAYQAAETGTPLIIVQPDSVTADQLRKLAKFAAQKAMPGVATELAEHGA